MCEFAADGMKMTEEDKATVTRRLIGGLAATGVLFALSLIPDKEALARPPHTHKLVFCFRVTTVPLTIFAISTTDWRVYFLA